MATVNVSNSLVHSTGAYCLSAGCGGSHMLVHTDYVCIPTLCTSGTANFNNLTVSGNLTVQGTTTTLNTTTCTTSAMSITNAGTGPALVVNQTGSQPILDFQDDGNSSLYIEDGGNVGIGTNNPANKLTITDGATPYTTANVLLQVKRNASNGNDDTSRAALMLANNNNGFNIAYGGTTDRLRFIDGGNNEVVTFENGGKVGIGSTDPGYTLDVNGDVRAQSDLYVGTGGGHFYNDSGSRVRINQDFYTNNSNTYIYGDNTYLGANSANDVIHTRDNEFRTRCIKAYSSCGLQFWDDSTTEYMRLWDGGTVSTGDSAGAFQLQNNSLSKNFYDNHPGAYYHAPSMIIRKDDSCTALCGIPASLVLYNNNGTCGTGTKLVFASRETAGAGNPVATAAIISRNVGGVSGSWACGDLAIMTKNRCTYCPAMCFDRLGRSYFQQDCTDWVGSNTYLRSSNEFSFLDGSNAQNARFKGIQVSDSYNGTIPNCGILFGADTCLLRSGAGELTLCNSGSNSTILNIRAKNAGNALVRAGLSTDGSQATGAFEVTQDGSYGGGISYNGDASPTFVSGETADHVTFYNLNAGTRTEVFHYAYNSTTVNFNATPTVGGCSVWHAGNMDHGSGLNADCVDGLEASSFVRSDTSDCVSGATYTFNSSSTAVKLQMLGHAGASNYNYFLNAANDCGTRAVHFVNGSTRSADGGPNAYTIRNDGGPFILGKSTYATCLCGNALTYNGATVWHAGNDGCGSGLNADLLDGNHGNHYLCRVTSQSFNSTSCNLNCISSNQGWYNWSSQPPANNPSTYGVLLHICDSSQAQQLVQTYGGAANKVRLFGRRKTNGNWDTSWTEYWSNANDGCGSGLNADCLDDLHASSFVRSDADDTKTGDLNFTSENACLTLCNYGRIGIGLTNPVNPFSLNLQNDSTFTSGLVFVKNSGNRGTRGHGSGSALFQYCFSDCAGMILNKDGNVGIAEATPLAKLHIRTVTGTDTPGNINSHIMFDVADDGGPAWAMRLGDTADDGDFNIDRRQGGSWANVMSLNRSDGRTTLAGQLCLTQASCSGGNIKFSAANPYICASSYIIMPGGLYVNGGTAYFSNRTMHRGGICNDSGTYLSIDGGTSNITRFSSCVGIGTTDPGSCCLQVQGESKIVGKLHVTAAINLCNSNLCNANHITINDPGTYEGLAWNSTAGNWVIDVSPLGRTNADGNLNFYNTGSNNIALWRPQLWVYSASCYATGTANSDGSLTITSTNTGADIFSIEGSNGTLFSVVDDLSDSLMSVNDAAGLPVLEVFADSSVCAGRYSCSDFYIACGGNIGIGTDSPDANHDLTIANNANYGIRFTGTNSTIQANANLIETAGNNLYLRPGSGYCTIIDTGNGLCVTGSLCIGGNSCLGNGNGDWVHVNDKLHIGATDSGDACLQFGEGTTANLSWGVDWNWDSGYTFAWHARCSGTNRNLVWGYNVSTNDYLCTGRCINMCNNSIHEINELAFTDSFRICDTGQSNKIFFCSGCSTNVRIELGSQTTGRGSLYANNGNCIGILDEGGDWAILHKNDTLTSFRDSGGTERLCIGTTQIKANEPICINANWSDGTHAEQLTIQGSHPSIALRSTNAGTSGNVNLIHVNGDGNLDFYSTPCNSGVGGASWTKRACISVGGNIWAQSALYAGSSGALRGASGDYGSVEVDGGATGGYEGFSIGGRAVFMHDNSCQTGLYNDVNNEWLFLGYHNADVRLYYNGAAKLCTLNTGVCVIGTSSNKLSSAVYSKPILEITTGSTPTQIKITTAIPYSGGGASTHAHSVTIRGFQYGSAQMADLQIGWHVYNNQFYNRTVTSSGSFAPTVTLAVENNYVVIHLASPGYWPKMYVESLYNAYGGEGHAQGWSWSDAAISADANTPNQTVPYKINFGVGADVKVGSCTVWHAGNDGSGSGLDADTLDGVQGSSFVRSDTADNLNGQLTMATQRALIASNYGHGVYGLYSSYRYQHVWSMGTSYNVCADGTNSGNLYGLAWSHTNAGGQTKSGLSHQLLLMMNGNTCTALGNGIWTAGGLTVSSHACFGNCVCVPHNIYHNGDLDTYYGFHAANHWRVVTGGSERIEIRDAETVINDSALNHDFRVESQVPGYLGNDNYALFVDASQGAVGIGTSQPSYALEVNGTAFVTGTFSAGTKNFLIDHPTKENYMLRHGSLEGPENAVYVRGTTTSSSIELPEYWTGLVDEDSITATLTPRGKYLQLFLDRVEDNEIHVGGTEIGELYDYVVYGTRKDVEDLVVEFERPVGS